MFLAIALAFVVCGVLTFLLITLLGPVGAVVGISLSVPIGFAIGASA